MVLSLGYRNYYFVKNKDEFEKKIKNFFKTKGPTFIDISTEVGILKNLKRPKNLKIIKKKFLKNF